MNVNPIQKNQPFNHLVETTAAWIQHDMKAKTIGANSKKKLQKHLFFLFAHHFHCLSIEKLILRFFRFDHLWITYIEHIIIIDCETKLQPQLLVKLISEKIHQKVSDAVHP